MVGLAARMVGISILVLNETSTISVFVPSEIWSERLPENSSTTERGSSRSTSITPLDLCRGKPIRRFLYELFKSISGCSFSVFRTEVPAKSSEVGNIFTFLRNVYSATDRERMNDKKNRTGKDGAKDVVDLLTNWIYFWLDLVRVYLVFAWFQQSIP